jgi:hypothetical protein
LANLPTLWLFGGLAALAHAIQGTIKPAGLTLIEANPLGVLSSAAKHGMRAYVRRRLDTFINPLVYTFADGHAPHSPTIMTMSRALAE